MSTSTLSTLELPITVAGPFRVSCPERIARPSEDLRQTPRSMVSPRTVLDLAAGVPLIPAEGNLSAAYRAAKRLFDVAGAALLLILFAPIMLAAWLVLTFTTGGKAIFRQERVGRCGRLFTMYKFRTMALDAAKRQHEVRNEKAGPIFKNRRDPRITPIGRFLRATSIDEMPQLINVLRGDMSLVGPRPPLAAEVARYEPWQIRRLAVKPGLTCLWQVSGRCEIEFDDWVRMDLWYIAHQSFWTDLALLVRTPWSVLTGRGAY